MATFSFEVPPNIFYSVGDENSFFQWIYRLSGYKTCVGSGQAVRIDFDPEGIDREAIVDLIAIFRRYGLTDFSPLLALVNTSDGAWFASPDKYWHKLVFRDAHDQDGESTSE